MFIASEVMRKFNGFFCCDYQFNENFLFLKIKLFQMIDLKSRFSLLFFSSMNLLRWEIVKM